MRSVVPSASIIRLSSTAICHTPSNCKRFTMRNSPRACNSCARERLVVSLQKPWSSLQNELDAVAQPQFAHCQPPATGTALAVVGAWCLRGSPAAGLWCDRGTVALRTSLAQVGWTGIFVWRGAVSLVSTALEPYRRGAAAATVYRRAAHVHTTRR